MSILIYLFIFVILAILLYINYDAVHAKYKQFKIYKGIMWGLFRILVIEKFINKIKGYKPKFNLLEQMSSIIIKYASKFTVKEDVDDIFVSYYYKGKMYKFIIPENIDNASLTDNEIIIRNKDDRRLYDVEMLLGPYNNFHCQRLTPTILGYETLKIKIGDKVLTYECDNEIIMEQ